MRGAALTLAFAACVHTPVVAYRPSVLEIVQTESDMAVQVVSDERIKTHEAREVEPSAVAAALIGSGQFLDDGARVLAAPIARRFANMNVDESVRIVGWSSDAPRFYYLVVNDGRIRVTSFLGGSRTDDYTSVIPTAAEPIVAPPEPVTTPPDAGIAAPPPDAAPVIAPPPPPPRPTATPRRSPHPDYKPISEAEARKRIVEIDNALSAGLITPNEHKAKRKEVLARL